MNFLSDYLHNGFSFVGFFLAGLAVNLTPCVYPMLSVTVSLFTTGKEGPLKARQASKKALVYVLGMAVMYSSLGLFAALTGTLFGSVLQNKWVLLLIALVMFYLALAMFGFYQIQLPAQWLGRLSALRRADYLGLFFSGMLVGVFAAPCMGPPILALLTAVGQKGDPVYGFTVFFIFSLGLGTPYFLLGTFSGLVQKLPRAGSWLGWIEHIFGVILTGFGFFYLAIALKPDWLDWILPATLIPGGLYLGFLERSGKEFAIFRRLKWVLGAAAIVTGITMMPLSQPEQELEWIPYEAQLVEAAREDHKPVVIDFYADWCITCHELEKFVFTHPSVVEELEKFVRLRVDATDMSSPDVEKIIDRYGVFGLPAVIFIDAGGIEVVDARVNSYIPPPEFLKSVKMTLEKSGSTPDF